LGILWHFGHGGELGTDATHGSVQAGASGGTVGGPGSSGEEDHAEQLQQEQRNSHFEGSHKSRTSHQMDVTSRTVQGETTRDDKRLPRAEVRTTSLLITGRWTAAITKCGP